MIQPLGVTYKEVDLSDEYYQSIRRVWPRSQDWIELEHQVGRLLNWKKIFKLCAGLNGDVLEFGCYQGQSILHFAHFLERNAMFNRRILGLDGFIGLPYSDGNFSKGQFSDTSLEDCRVNVGSSPTIYETTKKNISIEKFLYSERGAILRYLSDNKFKKFCFIHIDCDVGQSALEIFDIIDRGDLLANECFLLFDDYGFHTTELSRNVDSYLLKKNDEWRIEVHSETVLTKNFRLTRR